VVQRDQCPKIKANSIIWLKTSNEELAGQDIWQWAKKCGKGREIYRDK